MPYVTLNLYNEILKIEKKCKYIFQIYQIIGIINISNQLLGDSLSFKGVIVYDNI